MSSSTNNQRPSHQFQRGTSLVEVLVVLVILVLGIFSIARLFPGGFIAVRSAENNTFADRLAQAQLETLKQNDAFLLEAVYMYLSDGTFSPNVGPDDLSGTTASPYGGDATLNDINKARYIQGETFNVPSANTLQFLPAHQRRLRPRAQLRPHRPAVAADHVTDRAAVPPGPAPRPQRPLGREGRQLAAARLVRHHRQLQRPRRLREPRRPVHRGPADVCPGRDRPADRRAARAVLAVPDLRGQATRDRHRRRDELCDLLLPAAAAVERHLRGGTAPPRTTAAGSTRPPRMRLRGRPTASQRRTCRWGAGTPGSWSPGTATLDRTLVAEAEAASNLLADTLTALKADPRPVQVRPAQPRHVADRREPGRPRPQPAPQRPAGQRLVPRLRLAHHPRGHGRAGHRRDAHPVDAQPHHAGGGRAERPDGLQRPVPRRRRFQALRHRPAGHRHRRHGGPECGGPHHRLRPGQRHRLRRAGPGVRQLPGRAPDPAVHRPDRPLVQRQPQAPARLLRGRPQLGRRHPEGPQPVHRRRPHHPGRQLRRQCRQPAPPGLPQVRRRQGRRRGRHRVHRHERSRPPGVRRLRHHLRGLTLH